MASKLLTMKEKLMDPKLFDYDVIDYAIPSKITIEYRYQTDFGNSECHQVDAEMFSIC